MKLGCITRHIFMQTLNMAKLETDNVFFITTITLTALINWD